MTKLFDRATNWIVDWPLLTMTVIALISAVAVLGYSSPDSVRRLFIPTEETSEETDTGTEVFDTPPDVEEVSVTGADAIIVAESESFFTPQGATAMREVVEALESLDHVSNVLWLDRVPVINIFGLDEPLFPRSTASTTRFEVARDKALAHPLVKGQLLSEDGKLLLLMIEFDYLFIEDDDNCTVQLRQIAEDVVTKYEDFDCTFRVTGRVPIVLTALDTHEANQLKFQLIGYGMIVLMSVILFRGIVAVIVLAMAPSLGVFWTLGIIRFFDFQDNPFNDVVLPVLISLVGLTDGVHLLVQIRRRRWEGLSPRKSARMGIRQVGLACALTSLTTAIGFGSLSLAHHDLVREFGWCCVMGVILTFIAVVSSIPLASSSFLGRWVHVGHGKGLIDRSLDRISGVIDFVLGQTGKLSLIAIIATIGLIGVSTTLRPDERQSNALPQNSEAAVALSRMDEKLGGLESASVRVWYGMERQADDPELLTVLRKVDALLLSEPLVGNPISIVNLLDALPGEGEDADRMSMLELLPPPLKRAFYTPEYRNATVSFRVQDLGIATYGPVFERVQVGLDEIADEHPEFGLSMEGNAIWRYENLYQIVIDLAASLGTASVIIFVVLALVYRSLRIGLISIVPNLLPLAVAATFLVITGQALELVSVCAFTVCLGIAVDDTIHFLTRYREELAVTDDQSTAIRNAFTGVGTALIMTTVVLVAGFSTVLFSDSRDHRIFASMAAITVAAALFADLIFLPALLARFAGKRSSG